MPIIPEQGESGASGFWTRISARIVLMLGFAYAASWWADQRFYSHFGIAPQDVGLTPTGGLGDIVGAIIRIGLWVAIALLALGVLPVLAVAAAGYAIEAKPEQGRGRRVVATLLAIVSGGLAFTVYGGLVGWIYAAAAGFVMLACLFGWWFFSPTRPAWKWSNVVAHLRAVSPKAAGQSLRSRWNARKARRRLSVEERRELDDKRIELDKNMSVKPTWPKTLECFSRTRTSWVMRVLDVFSIVAVVGLLLVDLPDDAARAGGCVVDNPTQAVKGIGAPIDFVHLILLDVYAQPATIAWIGSTTPPPSIDQNPFSGVYLGTSNGTAVVYRPTSPTTLLRLPASDITVSVDPTTKTCKEAH